MDDLYWGIIGFVSVLSLMVLGVHVGLALAATGFVGMFLMTGKITLALALFTTTPYSTTNVYAFAILPLFIIMGLFAMHAGLSARAFDAAYKWVGRLPGGMAIATTWANAMFAACTGSSVVACAVFTRISLPEMYRRRYDKAFACGTIAAAGMLGMLIPPSALMIVYGILTEQSIGKLLIAGVGPGILLTLIFTIGIVGGGSAVPREGASRRIRASLCRAAQGHHWRGGNFGPRGGHYRRHVHRDIHPHRGRSGRSGRRTGAGPAGATDGALDLPEPTSLWRLPATRLPICQRRAAPPVPRAPYPLPRQCNWKSRDSPGNGSARR